MRQFFLLLAVLCLSLAGLAGCRPEPLPPGVVALVNGRPITLRMVEARHDADGAYAAVSQNPSVALLREQYGHILAELVTQELVAQELERLGLGVSEDDVDSAVRRVQDDYPEGLFDETLFAENIDEHAWRDLMRYTLVMLRFNEQVLRPQVSLTDDEVVRYYNEHAAEFLVPAHDVLRVLTAPSRASLETARARLLEGRSLLDLADVQVQRIELRPSLAPEIWQKALSRLKQGQVSEIQEVDGVWQCVFLEKRVPTGRMDPLDAYPLIEQALLEWKLKTLFAEWLDAATAEARIEMTPLLRLDGTVHPDEPDERLPLDSEPIGEDSDGADAAKAPQAGEPEPGDATD